MKIKTPAIVLATAIIAACSSSSDSDISDQTSTPTPGNSPDDTDQSSARFNGNYATVCAAFDDGFIWEISEVSIQDGIANIRNTEYDDSECTQPADVIELTASFALPGGNTNTALGDADFLDITLETTSLNGVDEPIENDRIFSLILLDGNNLYLGLETDDPNGESADTRYDQIDQTRAYVRL